MLTKESGQPLASKSVYPTLHITIVDTSDVSSLNNGKNSYCMQVACSPDYDTLSSDNPKIRHNYAALRF